MFRLSSIASAAASGAFNPFKFTNFRRGFLCAAVILRIAYPLTITTAAYTGGAAGTLAATINGILNSAIGVFSESYGKNATYKPYAGVTGSEMRTIHRAMMLREVPNNIPASIPVGPFTANIDVILPFAVQFLEDGRLRLPGWSQMRTMQLDIIEGAAFNNTVGGTAARTGGGQVTIDIDVMCYPATQDRWTPLLSFYKANNSDYEVQGPDGIHVAAWDDNNPFATNLFTVFSVLFDTVPQADGIPPYAIDDKWTDYWVDGGSNIDDSETVILAPEFQLRASDLPAGRISFRQPALYVPTLKLRGLYWPVLSQAEAMEAADIGATTEGGPVKLHTPSGLESLPDKHARSNPATIARPTDNSFTTKAGWLVRTAGAVPEVDVPNHVANAAKSAVAAAAASGDATKGAADSSVTKAVAKSIPGFGVVAASAQGPAAGGILRSALPQLGAALS